MAKVPPGTRRIEIYLPHEVAKPLEDLLRSELLGRVPHGAWSGFVVQRIREFFTARRATLEGFNGFQSGDWIMGNDKAVELVLDHLTRSVPDEIDAAFPELDPRR